MGRKRKTGNGGADPQVSASGDGHNGKDRSRDVTDPTRPASIHVDEYEDA